MIYISASFGQNNFTGHTLKTLLGHLVDDDNDDDDGDDDNGNDGDNDDDGNDDDDDDDQWKRSD